MPKLDKLTPARISVFPPVVSGPAMAGGNAVFRSAHLVLSGIASGIVSHDACIYPYGRVIRFLVRRSPGRSADDGSGFSGPSNRRVFVRHGKSDDEKSKTKILTVCEPRQKVFIQG